MIKFENTYVFGFEGAIKGMRLPMKSKSDSDEVRGQFKIGEKDLKLAKRLAQAGPDHGKFLRMIHVQTTITAPAYWVAEHDTYKVATTRNSESFMHKGVSSGFVLEQFDTGIHSDLGEFGLEVSDAWVHVLNTLNELRRKYNKTKDERYFQMIRKLLPSGWLITYEWDANYATLRNIYHQRKNHRLPEWQEFCTWIEGLPYSELITEANND